MSSKLVQGPLTSFVMWATCCDSLSQPTNTKPTAQQEYYAGEAESDPAPTTLPYPTLPYTTLHYTTLHYTTLHYTTLHYTAESVKIISSTFAVEYSW